jgi:hypothetical protein
MIVAVVRRFFEAYFGEDRMDVLGGWNKDSHGIIFPT